MSQEHPFAQYVRILGKGRNGSRGLTAEETSKAMGMILRDEVEPMQLGAFLMLMRVKEETADEVAASVRAVRESLTLPANPPQVDVDWSSYAGKKRILPWYLLATLLMAQNGIRIFMHGASGHTEGRIYTKEILPKLGIEIATSMEQALEQLQAHNFTYLDLEYLSPKMHEIIELRPLLGLRSPVHTIARMLNPLQAPTVMQGIFHPGYQNTHQEAGLLLEQPRMTVIKGEGGEIERNPDMACLLQSVRDGKMVEEEWPPMFERRHVRPDEMNTDHLMALWRGELEDEYAEASVIGTVAITLYTMGRASSREDAETQARSMWESRDRSQLHRAA